MSLYGKRACAVGLKSYLNFGQLENLEGIVVAFCMLLNDLEEDATISL